MLAAPAHCADTPRTPDMPDMPDMPDTRGTPAHDASPRPEHKPHGKMLHPVVMMIWVLAAAVALTWLVDSGRYARNGKLVVPGTYQVVPKATSLATLVAPAVSKSTPQLAMPASLVSAFVAVPGGLVKNAPLIVMVMFVGGMFGVMRRTGVVDAGIDRLLQLTGNDVYLLTPLLMILIGLGSTLLGFISEYLVIIPMVMVIAKRLGLSNLFAVALVALAAKIGYIASVTNPLALAVAQPLVGVPLFSGVALRAAVFAVYLALGILYLLHHVKRSGYRRERAKALAHAHGVARLSVRHQATLALLAAAVAMLVFGTRELKWGNVELAAFYAFVAIAADAFVDGMKSMMLAALLMGLAASVELLLQNSLVLDTLIHLFTRLANGQSPVWVANGLMAVQMVLDVFIPSVSGKAAVSMPIIGPIAQLSGVSGQTSVLAFVLGGGLTNLVTPTSGMLLAYLATARVDFGAWLRFVLPLFAVLLALSCGVLAFAVQIGY
ncbi:C4-dicarboxylate anaerobic carrier family protein [Burkholderia mallei NCTC 10247]|uniref:YfcC family protein n=1 Tax=Burkholderia mallei TaxID=13373 RepID=UPI0000F27822|nr:YfcC family protein [Burkholderia mallei]ABO03477.1 C4-dicarboxylate anaerobic carrier family protein [Burkholderia mallei NCTC 10247]AIO56483.1 C4-dicarboxylate anaerobic carrier family protein [Burkholderia mallei]AIS27538.1 C4-dicarboxylate anaerobic carrier family protein [Burkholderia mallei NCTC 10247]AIW48058.1 C4-dicarboxylate ABC transporter [Burkholderia mallei]AJX45477.1 C4-dicarboxylate anaerobic carrier family protein [Burkholderia mallei]